MVVYHSSGAAKAPPPPIPTDMVQLMKALAKQVLKQKPDNIYEFSAHFFEQLLIQRDGSLDKGYGKFRSYTAYCAISEKMNERAALKSRQRRALENATDSGVASGASHSTVSESGSEVAASAEDVVAAAPMEVCGVAIAAVARQTPKMASKMRTTAQTVAVESNTQATDTAALVKPKVKPRKLSSKKPADNLIAITEETSTDVADTLGGTARQVMAARRIQKAFRRYRNRRADTARELASQMWAATVIQRAYRGFGATKLSGKNGTTAEMKIIADIEENASNIPDDITERSLSALLLSTKQKSQSIDSNSDTVDSVENTQILEPITHDEIKLNDVNNSNDSADDVIAKPLTIISSEIVEHNTESVTNSVSMENVVTNNNDVAIVEYVKNISPEILEEKAKSSPITVVEHLNDETMSPIQLVKSAENEAETEKIPSIEHDVEAENKINTTSNFAMPIDPVIANNELIDANNKSQDTHHDTHEHISDLANDLSVNEQLQNIASTAEPNVSNESGNIINNDPLVVEQHKPEAIAASIVDDILDRVEVIEELCVQKIIHKLVDDDTETSTLVTETNTINIDESSNEQMTVINKSLELPAIGEIDKSIIDEDKNMLLSSSVISTDLQEANIADISAAVESISEKEETNIPTIDNEQLLTDNMIDGIKVDAENITSEIQSSVVEKTKTGNDENSRRAQKESEESMKNAVEIIESPFIGSVNDDHQDDDDNNGSLTVKSNDDNLLVASPLTLPDDNDVSEQSSSARSTVIEVNTTDDMDNDDLLDNPFGQIVEKNVPLNVGFHHKPTAAMLSDRRHTIATIAEDLSEHIFELASSADARDIKTAPELQSLPEEVAYEPLLSSGEQSSDSTVATTDEMTAESSTESVTTSNKDDENDMSDVENVDLSSYGEDSLEAMYYSLRKNEIVLDKMQNRRNVIKGKSDEGSLFSVKQLNEGELDEAVDDMHIIQSERMSGRKSAEIEDAFLEDGTKSMATKPDTDIEDTNVVQQNADISKENIDDQAENNLEQQVEILQLDDKSKPAAENVIKNISAEKDTNDERDSNIALEQNDEIISDDHKPDDKELHTKLDGTIHDENEIIDVIKDGNTNNVDTGNLSKTDDVNVNETVEPQTSAMDEHHFPDNEQNITQPFEQDSIESDNIGPDMNTKESDDGEKISELTDSVTEPKQQSSENAFKTAGQEPLVTNSSIHNINSSSVEKMETTEFAPKVELEEVSNDLAANQSNDEASASATENPIEFAMQKQRQLLDRMHGSSMYADGDGDTGDDNLLHPFDRHPDIQRNMWTSSVSETDSDYVDLDAQQRRRLVKDDFNISTAYGHTAISSSTSSTTSSDSQTATTIVSAVTRIQAGARGFLARRRLRRSSMATTVVDASPASRDSHHQLGSFGNAAIDASLEAMVERNERLTLENAARIIQRFYRRRLMRADDAAADQPQRSTTTNDDGSMRHGERAQLDGSSSRNGLNDAAASIGDYDEAHAVEDDGDDDGEDNNAAENTIRVSISPASHQYDVLETINIAANDAHNVPTNQLSIVGVESSGCDDGNDDGGAGHSSLLAVATPATTAASAADDDATATTTAATSTTAVASDGVSRRLDSEEAHQQRRLMLQRGDAVQRNSTPDDEGDNDGNNGSNGGKAAAAIDAKVAPTAANVVAATAPTNATVVRIGATTASKSNNLMRRRLLGMRQNSMPVQIDSEFIRIIPKHLRKRIKSADSVKKTSK